jgi:hypothetical protein
MDLDRDLQTAQIGQIDPLAEARERLVRRSAKAYLVDHDAEFGAERLRHCPSDLGERRSERITGAQAARQQIERVRSWLSNRCRRRALRQIRCSHGKPLPLLDFLARRDVEDPDHQTTGIEELGRVQGPVVDPDLVVQVA